jgi:sec-independent protein translocase protein TatA
MPSWIGLPEILVLLVIVLLIFGPKKLPELGRSLGRGMREFKDSITGKDDDKQLEERNVEQAAPVAPAAPVATTATTADEEARAQAAKPADAS